MPRLRLRAFRGRFEAMLRLKATGVIAGTANFPDERGLRLASRRGLRLLQHHITPLGLNVRPVSPRPAAARGVDSPIPGPCRRLHQTNTLLFWWVICSTGPSQWAVWYHVRAGDASLCDVVRLDFPESMTTRKKITRAREWRPLSIPLRGAHPRPHVRSCAGPTLRCLARAATPASRAVRRISRFLQRAVRTALATRVTPDVARPRLVAPMCPCTCGNGAV